jgi:hypothetical protein
MAINEIFLLKVSLVIFVFFLIFTILKIRKKTISSRSLVLFLIAVVSVAACRLALYFYLKIFVPIPHYQYSFIENVLSLLLYPEVPISYVLIPSLMSDAVMNPVEPVYYQPMFWLILTLLFTFGSFIWLLPTLILLAEKKQKAQHEK